MSKEPEMETMREIWGPDGEFVIEVGPDRDGLGCVEIRLKDPPDSKTDFRLPVSPAVARLLSQAIALCAEELGRGK